MSKATASNPIRDEALRLAGKGFHVLPLHSWTGRSCTCGKVHPHGKAAKHPHEKLVPNGVKDATTDPKTIRKWFANGSRPNLGLAAGPSDLLILDVDDPSKLAILEALAGGELPPGPRQITPRGGGAVHLVFKLPEGVEHGNSLLVDPTGTPIAGIDVRGGNAYVAVAPSASDLGPYQWEDDLPPGEIEIPEIPAGLLAALKRKKAHKADYERSENGVEIHRTEKGLEFEFRYDEPPRPEPVTDEELETLLANSEKLATTWNLERPEFVHPEDGSPDLSRYALSVVNHAALSRFSPAKTWGLLERFYAAHGAAEKHGEKWFRDHVREGFRFAAELEAKRARKKETAAGGEETKERKPKVAELAIAAFLDGGTVLARTSAFGGEGVAILADGRVLPLGVKAIPTPLQSEIRNRYRERFGTVFGSQIREVVDELRARSSVGPILPISYRAAVVEGVAFLDLGTEDGKVVRIDGDGWTIVHNPPGVLFGRTGSTRSLPIPEVVAQADRSKVLDEFRDLLRLSREDYALALGWTLAILRPDLPAPILVVEGPAGSGKSTILETLRRAVDPSSPLTVPPISSPEDLHAIAKRARVVALNNVSRIPTALSDPLCQLATEGGFAKRALYTDDELATLEGFRAIGITGLGGISTKPDLVDRFSRVELTTDRLRGARADEFADRFAELHPRLLGALLSAVSEGIRNGGSVGYLEGVRMPLHASWIEATGAFSPGEYADLYRRTREESIADAIEAHSVGEFLLRFLDSGARDGAREIQVSASELLRRLDDLVHISGASPRDWPTVPTHLSAVVAELEGPLRRHGWTFTRKRTKRGRILIFSPDRDVLEAIRAEEREERNRAE